MAILSKVLFLASGVNAFLISSKSDPMCANGIRSMPSGPDSITVCCPAYCGRCNDYDTCKEVNGQASEDACCASKVTELACENNAEDPYCLKKCDKKSAPCSLGIVPAIQTPKTTSAAADCGKPRKPFADVLKDTLETTNGEDHKEEVWDLAAKMQKKNEMVSEAQANADHMTKIVGVYWQEAKLRNITPTKEEVSRGEEMVKEAVAKVEEVKEVKVETIPEEPPTTTTTTTTKAPAGEVPVSASGIKCTPSPEGKVDGKCGIILCHDSCQNPGNCPASGCHGANLCVDVCCGPATCSFLQTSNPFSF